MDGYWIKLRGMPYRTTMDDILEFLSGVKVKGNKRGINFPTNQRNVEWGEAFIELETEEDLEKAKAKNNEHMGRRYIEVFSSSKSDMIKACKAPKEDVENGRGKSRQERSRSPVHDRGLPTGNFVVKLKGIPYNAAKEDLKEFFQGLKILPDGMSILVDHTGKALGDAFVQFATHRDFKIAKDKNGSRIGHRYIEVFESSIEEANFEIRRQMERNDAIGSRMDSRSPNGQGRDEIPSRTGYSRTLNSVPFTIVMRGVSVHTKPHDVFRFFRPITPVNVEMKFHYSSPEGDAFVDFASEEEALSAVSRNRDRPLDGAPVILTPVSLPPARHEGHYEKPEIVSRSRSNREQSRGIGGRYNEGDYYSSRSYY